MCIDYSIQPKVLSRTNKKNTKRDNISSCSSTVRVRADQVTVGARGFQFNPIKVACTNAISLVQVINFSSQLITLIGLRVKGITQTRLVSANTN